jgi:RNA polymerase sigma factor for flagellar operon FliA
MNCVAAYAVVQAQPTDEQLLRYAPLVKRIAHHLMGRLPHSVQVDDLVQAGMMGLLEALRNFDNTQGASFETYAGIRIRGAMLDEVRRNDWAPRSVHRKARQVSQAIHAIESRNGHEASAREIAEELGLSLDEYHELVQEARGHKLFSLDESTIGDDPIVEHIADERAGVVEKLQDDEFQGELSEAIAGLPERERMVMALYYEQELNLKEIGAVLGVTESRVCQIHGQALMRLRARLVA